MSPRPSAETFPLAFPNQDPGDDLVAALSMVRVVIELLSEGHAIPASTAQNILTVIHTAVERIEPVADFLDKMPGDQRKPYAAARRQWIVRNAGRAEVIR